MRIKLTRENGKIPVRATKEAAAYDIHAAIPSDLTIYPGQVLKIPSGFAMALESNLCGLILPRSGLASKRGLRPANTPGLIDPDYRGEVIVALRNDSDSPQTIQPDDRIAQLLIVPFASPVINVVDNLGETGRADGGFGSTGI